MEYEYAKDAFEELKNFEGKAHFPNEDVVIDFFVLLPKHEADNINIINFLEHHHASTGFEVEGDHKQEYTIMGINLNANRYSIDEDYFLKLIVW